MNIEPLLQMLTVKISQDHEGAISIGQPVPPGAIQSEVNALPYDLTSDEKTDLTRLLEGRFTTSQTRGSSVTSDYRPWLQERRSSIDFYYWRRLKRYYLANDTLPPTVVASLDAGTDELLDYCGNPEDDGSWGRRGMVMGHVQSGKTTNYSALICKAADAGYGVVILLSGITNSLRAQTQERLDETFIGKVSVFQPIVMQTLPILRFADGVERFPAYGTSRDRDFSKSAASTVGMSLSALREPIIFVTKKNKSTLERLRDWLREQNHGHRIHVPLILIDDEADNASVNTAADTTKTTAINRAIREILQLFDRCSYVGYTATPFANIFIDPDTADEMLSDDLFPRHFIKALDPPSNYVGASRMFDENGDLRVQNVRIVDDYLDILPLAHKRDHRLEDLPPSLYQAIRTYLLTRAVRILRGHGRAHCSMMINVSRFNDVQSWVHGHVYRYLETVKDSVIVNGGCPIEGITDGTFLDLAQTWDEEFSDLDVSFLEVSPVLREAVGSVLAMTINMRGGSLDYRKHVEFGLHVIAIGGLALSRGLTLEGLTVSYILRNTAASDTLMQMARWFGYRPGYEDLCRVFLPNSSLNHYEYIADAVEELRSEVRRMEALGETPADFGLKVRQSPSAIRITAANKMRSATSMTLAQDYSARHIEGYVICNDDAVNRNNLRKVREFLAGSAVADPEPGALCWVADGTEVLHLLKDFKFPPEHQDLGHIVGTRSLFYDYVSDRVAADLDVWDVALAHPKKTEMRSESDVLGFPVPLRLRSKGRSSPDKTAWSITGSKNRVSVPEDARLLLSKEQKDKAKTSESKGDRALCEVRTRPLLLLHLFKGAVAEPEKEGDPPYELMINGPAISLSFCLPETNVAPVERMYQVNMIYKRQLELFSEAPDDDEDQIFGETGD